MRTIARPMPSLARSSNCPALIIAARKRARLTQAELAARMNTTQSVVARLESGRSHPSTNTLEKVATATRQLTSNQL